MSVTVRLRRPNEIARGEECTDAKLSVASTMVRFPAQ